MAKAFYFDVETTGKSAWKQDIVQISGIIEIDGVVKETFNLLSRPINVDEIQDEALQVIGKTKDQLMKYPHPSETKKKLQKILAKYVNKFDKSDKFIPVGYNTRFDMDFIHSFWKKQKDMYLGSYLSWYYVDVMAIANIKNFNGEISLQNHKLATLCDHFGIKIDAHDAMSDIIATRELFGKLTGKQMEKIENKGRQSQPVQEKISSSDVADEIPF